MNELSKEILGLREGYQSALAKAETVGEIGQVALGLATGIMQWSRMFQSSAHKDMALMFSATLMDVAEKLQTAVVVTRKQMSAAEFDMAINQMAAEE